jgi:hypothetical protein
LHPPCVSRPRAQHETITVTPVKPTKSGRSKKAKAEIVHAKFEGSTSSQTSSPELCDPAHELQATLYKLQGQYEEERRVREAAEQHSAAQTRARKHAELREAQAVEQARALDLRLAECERALVKARGDDRFP